MMESSWRQVSQLAVANRQAGNLPPLLFLWGGHKPGVAVDREVREEHPDMRGAWPGLRRSKSGRQSGCAGPVLRQFAIGRGRLAEVRGRRLCRAVAAFAGRWWDSSPVRQFAAVPRPHRRPSSPFGPRSASCRSEPPSATPSAPASLLNTGQPGLRTGGMGEGGGEAASRVLIGAGGIGARGWRRGEWPLANLLGESAQGAMSAVEGRMGADAVRRRAARQLATFAWHSLTTKKILKISEASPTMSGGGGKARSRLIRAGRPDGGSCARRPCPAVAPAGIASCSSGLSTPAGPRARTCA
jgi:hypothetical protein